MRTVGSILILVGLVAGLALAGLLFQWDNSQRAAAMATPTEEAAAPTAPASAQSATGATSTAQAPGQDTSGGAIQNGKVVYNNFCNGCHPNGKAGVGPAIAGTSEATVKTMVRQGGGGMPTFGQGQISDDQLAQLAAYVASLK